MGVLLCEGGHNKNVKCKETLIIRARERDWGEINKEEETSAQYHCFDVGHFLPCGWEIKTLLLPLPHRNTFFSPGMMHSVQPSCNVSRGMHHRVTISSGAGRGCILSNLLKQSHELKL